MLSAIFEVKVRDVGSHFISQHFTQPLLHDFSNKGLKLLDRELLYRRDWFQLLSYCTLVRSYPSSGFWEPIWSDMI